MAGFVRRFGADEDGATAIEYALIAGLIAVAIISTISTLGTTVLNNLFQKVADAMTS